MKNLQFINKTTGILLASLMVIGASSCKKQLDKTPLSQYSNEGFWNNESDAMMALAAVYRGGIQQQQTAQADVEFTLSDWWGYHGLIFMDLATDNMYDRRGENTDLNRLTNGALVSGNSYVRLYWTSAYSRIARCNYFLENIERVPMDAAKKTRMAAEARFIRAAMYFYMSQFWKDVPLVTNTLTVEEANTVTKTQKAEIVAFVASELQAAAADLPQFRNLLASEKGRASKQAALAFLGRLYLGEKKFADAAAVYKQIMDFNDNTIDPNYKSLFNGSNENSSEIIFATQYQADLQTNGILLHVSPAKATGYHFCNPLASLVESYDFTDGTPFSYSDPRYNPNDIGENRDPRLRYTVFYNGQAITESSIQGAKYVSHPDSTTSVDQLTLTKQATRSGYGFRKVLPASLPSLMPNSGIDLPIIRYAEVLLSYLEAKLENGDPIDQALLDATINRVRGRASVGLPQVTVTDPVALREILRKERRVETACEGIRLWDLLRWGKAGELLNADFYGASFPGATNLRKKGTTVDPFSRWYVTTKAFRVGIDDKWPIPQTEQDINPNLR